MCKLIFLTTIMRKYTERMVMKIIGQMKNRYNLFILYLSILLWLGGACSKDNGNTVYYDAFSKEVQLTGEIVNIDDTVLHNYPLLTIIEDKLVILDFATDNYYYHVYDTIDYSYKYSFAKRGRGAGEVMDCGSLKHNGNILYVDNSLNRSEIYEYRIADDKAELVDTIRLPRKDDIIVVEFVVTPNKVIWGLPVYGKSHRLYKMKDGGLYLDSLFIIPKNPEWSLANPIYTWNSRLGYNSSNKILVLATTGGERLDIINTQNNDSLTIIGPGGNPCPDARNGKMHLDSKIIGFGNIQITDNYIYALFSGQNYQDMIWNHEEETFSMNVYTLDGKPVIKYHFDKPIISIFVDEENRTMYTTAVTGEEEESIVKYRF